MKRPKITPVNIENANHFRVVYSDTRFKAAATRIMITTELIKT